LGQDLFRSSLPVSHPEEDLVLMRRNYLLSAAMLSALLATSACGAASPVPAPSLHPARLAGSGAGDGSTGRPEIGISQWNAAEAARKAKTQPAAATKDASAATTKPAAAKAEAAPKTEPAGAANAESAEKAAAANAAAVEKAAAAAEKKAAAKKETAPAAAKTPPAEGGLKRVTPVPVATKTAPAPAPHGSAEPTVGSDCGAPHATDNIPEVSVKVSPQVLPDIAVGIGTDAGTDTGTADAIRCLD
jgi:hypothetical protein